MIQSFQCPVCGNLNAIGEPECTNCGQNFVYNCPVCGSQINNRYSSCPNCRTYFNWGMQQPDMPAQQGTRKAKIDKKTEPVRDNYPGEAKEKTGPGITSRPTFWVILIVACAILIALLLIADRLVNA